MSMAPRYPQPTWACSVCGSENPGDIGQCMGTCRGGAVFHDDSSRPSGGIEHGAIPYFPCWHVRKEGFDVNDAMLTCPEKYPHWRER